MEPGGILNTFRSAGFCFTLTLMMAIVHPSETSINLYQTVRCHMLEDGTLRTGRLHAVVIQL
jgi:hypothetical protein